MKEQMGLDNTLTRWKKTAKTDAPLKSYAKQILEQQKIAYTQFGINQKKITGTKTFQNVLKKIKNEKEEIQEKNPTKIPVVNTLVQKQIKVETLQQNFFKAKLDVTKLIHQKTLQEFLEENYILEYLPTFKEAGINDLEGLRYLSKQELGQLGVKAGHQVKIIKKIKEEFDAMLNRKEQKIQQIKTQEKISFGYGDGDINNYDDLKKMQLEENNGFNQQQFSDEESYEQEEQDEVLITVPMHEIELQTVQAESLNCYECYKKIANISAELERDQKYFCSQECLRHYLLQFEKKCPACGTKFLKTEGFHENGLWFCSLGCCPNHQQIQQLFFQWHGKNG